MASIISLVGAPGSGKGTYGALLASRLLNACFLSVGDILREQATTNKQLASVMSSGSLVDDALVNDAVVQSLQDRAGKKGIVILDGYPRNSEQASLLANWPTRLLPSFAIQFDVPDHVCITKILGRRKCTICNKSLNVNGVNTDGFNMPPMLPKEGDCKVQCNPDKDWQKRDDDTEETIKLRFEVYHNETKPVLQYWKEREQLVRFVPYNGVQDIDKLVKVVEPQLKGISKE